MVLKFQSGRPFWILGLCFACGCYNSSYENTVDVSQSLAAGAEAVDFDSKNLDDDDSSGADKTSKSKETVGPLLANDLEAPLRLKADGEPIDIGLLSSSAHAGPCIADVDGDGVEDLFVGDFPGYFWFFKNEGSNQQPQYVSKGKFQVEGEAAKTPVY
ncbi:MAG: hypothetical protein AAF939_18905 [Planctomycetota bacterium]